MLKDCQRAPSSRPTSMDDRLGLATRVKARGMRSPHLVATLSAALFASVALVRAIDTPLFLTPTSKAVGDGLPTALLTPDLNGDGRADLVVTHYQEYKITPLLNNGDGTLTVLAARDTGGNPLGAASADMDGDGHADVVLVELESDNAWFIRGRGDGNLDDARGPIFVGHDPLVVAAGDFNEDDRVDLAVARSPEGGGYLSVVLGNGDGTFAAPVFDYRLNDVGVAVTVADVDKDGHQDLIGSYSQTSIALFRGRGDGTFATPQEIVTGSRTPIVRALNLDGDDSLDLFLVLTNVDAVATMRGRGDGTFEAPLLFAAGESPAYPVLADINQDDAVDVVIQSIVSFDVRVMLGDGTGRFAPLRSFAANGMAQLMTALDLNGDGAVEVVAATAPGGDAGLSLFTVLADGSLAAPENLIGTAATAAVAADSNDDDLPDLIVAIPTIARIGAFLSRATEGYSSAVLSEPLSFPVGRVATGDFDEDGNVDVLAASAVSRAAAWLRGNGVGTFTLVQSLPLSSGGAVAGAIVADMDGDGHLDAILAQANGSIVVFQGNGDGTFAESVVTSAIASTVAPALGDFNGDGLADLAAVDTRQSRIVVLLGDGSGRFTIGPTIPASRQVTSVLAADFNLDGSDDVAFSDLANRGLGVALNDGGGQFAASVTVPTDDTFMAAVACDLAGDARPDLTVAAQERGVVTAFVNDGTFTASALAGTGLKPIAILAADFNGDGRYDISTINDTTGTIATIVTTVGGNAVVRGDGNGDGETSAADLVTLTHKLSAGEANRVDTSGRGFPASTGVDANGDRLIGRQDMRAMMRRIFR